ncbi:uncharacterized protein [Clytia hemisphaerica]|uniref:Uncharacterized protein n=1 Tax=Clytia hemisphaerica TaxID=252671 RepID=A0A7M5VE16_9CNID
MANIANKVLSLRPLPIDPTRCTPDKSLYEQILNNRPATSERQAKQFNLGNTHRTANPIDAADFILEREYGDSFLFDQTQHTSIFIPPTFVSKQYVKKNVALLEYDVRRDMDRLLVNLKQHSPTYWLTKELETFMNAQNKPDCIDKKSFERWILNVQIMYLVINELKTDNVTFPPITQDLGTFVQGCVEELQSRKSYVSKLLNWLGIWSYVSPLESLLSDFISQNYPIKSFKRKILALIESNPSSDSNLLWLFGLELSELGEELEHWFYDQLLPLQNNTLQDTVVLSSLTFLTNVQKKMHKETDFLIISWSRKLIISIELKRTIVGDQVFKQLEKNHRIFEERLGDQLMSGWTYFPVVCVQEDTLSINSQHYITVETEIEPWLSSIFYRFQNISTTTTSIPLDDVKNLLKILVFAIHVSKKDQVAPITSSTWVEYTSKAIENVSTSHNILFYSNQQMAIMSNDDPRYRRVIICGPFGSGKTLLLQEKAIRLNEKSEHKGKVMFICHRNLETLKTLLYHRLKIELEENRGILVEHLEGKFNVVQDRLTEKIKSRDIKALFMDEFNTWPSKIIDWIKEKVTPLVDYLWIVPSTESITKRHYEQLSTITNFSFLNLEQNFRNSKEVVQATNLQALKSKYSYREGIVMPPGNFPSGCSPLFVDSFKDAVKEIRKITDDGILVIIDFDIQPDHCFDILDELKENWRSYHTLRDDFGKDENPYKFLLDRNVLIIDNNISFGLEWSSVIVFEGDGHKGDTYHYCNYMLRCTTNLVVVKKSDGSRWL